MRHEPMFLRACLWLICNYRLPLVSPFRNRPFSISTLRHRVPSRSSLKFSNDSTLLTYRPPSVSPPRNHLPSRSRLKFRAFFNHRPSSVSPPRIRLPSRSPLLFSNDSNLFNHLPHPILSVPRRFISDHHLSLLVDCDLTRYNYDRKNDENILIDNSQIYCQGDLLRDVALARIFEDSKTFVDKKLRFPEREILEKYAMLKSTAGNRGLTKDQITKFVEDNFEDAVELENWQPPDFTDRPALISLVADWKYQKWLLLLNQIWKQLGKKMDIDVLVNADRHSLIYVENGFFIPGGRFLELYYWDTYWIVRGALLCDMPHTARGIIENILSIVKRYGYMMNGSRRYYIGRSQPPLLIQMAATYYTTTNDLGFIKTNILTLEQEFQWWLKNRMVAINKDGNVYILGHYQVQTAGPRPESYREDYELAMNLTSEAAKNQLYNNLKAAAESGWDFTSRYFNDRNGMDTGGLENLDTPNFINVDLNAILHANAVTLAEWFHILDDPVKAMYYKNLAKRFLIGIEAVLWSEEDGIWFDYDLRNERQRKQFYPSNFAPLWTGSYTFPKPLVARSAVRHLMNYNLISPNYIPTYYGAPTSLRNSTQQWDFPNCWPPLQAMVIQGLDRTYDITAQLVAYNLASKWVYTNYIGFSRTGTMFEKYDALRLGSQGGGGEYKSQTGFGWTNGVIFELFARWGNLLTSAEDSFQINHV